MRSRCLPLPPPAWSSARSARSACAVRSASPSRTLPSDVKRRELIVHRDPRDGRYTSVRTLGEHDTATAVAVDLAVPLAELL